MINFQINKKILFIFLGLLIILISLLLIYFSYQPLPKKPNQEETTSSINSSSNSLSSEKSPQISSKILKLSTEPIVPKPIFAYEKIKYYLAKNGNVFELNPDGSEAKIISSSVLLDLNKVIWSPNGNQVISIFVHPDDNVEKYFYDYQSGQSVKLNPNIQWIAWSPNGDKIAYHYYNPETEINNISISNPDGSHWQNILNIRLKDLIIEWPHPDYISLRTKASGLAEGFIYLLNIKTKALQKVLGGLNGLTGLWSPQGDKILFAYTNEHGKELQLAVANKEGKIIKKLPLKTLPEKCVWSRNNRVIYCAVPQTIPENALLPDDFYKGLLDTSDNFWKINLETGEKEFINLYGNQQFNATDLILSSLENYLIFINQKDGYLYSLKLK